MKKLFEVGEFWDEMPQTEDSSERGFVPTAPGAADPSSYKELGKSDNDDDSGDIADEGRGHRG